MTVKPQQNLVLGKKGQKKRKVFEVDREKRMGLGPKERRVLQDEYS